MPKITNQPEKMRSAPVSCGAWYSWARSGATRNRTAALMAPRTRRMVHMVLMKCCWSACGWRTMRPSTPTSDSISITNATDATIVTMP